MYRTLLCLWKSMSKWNDQSGRLSTLNSCLPIWWWFSWLLFLHRFQHWINNLKWTQLLEWWQIQKKRFWSEKYSWVRIFQDIFGGLTFFNDDLPDRIPCRPCAREWNEILEPPRLHHVSGTHGILGSESLSSSLCGLLGIGNGWPLA